MRRIESYSTIGWRQDLAEAVKTILQVGDEYDIEACAQKRDDLVQPKISEDKATNIRPRDQHVMLHLASMCSARHIDSQAPSASACHGARAGTLKIMLIA